MIRQTRTSRIYATEVSEKSIAVAWVRRAWEGVIWLDQVLTDCSEKNLSLGVFFLSKNEWFASTNDLASADLASVALKLEGNLLGCLCLLSEHGFGLTTETFLLGIVAAFALSSGGILALLVLGDLVDLMLAALHAVCVFLFRSVHLDKWYD